MPIYNFRLIPYLYDAFKPALVAHCIIFDDTPYLVDLDNEYFNKNYEYYWLSVGRLADKTGAYVRLDRSGDDECDEVEEESGRRSNH